MPTERAFPTRFFAATDSLLARPPAWVGAVAALAMLQLFLIWTHQPWSDELQALMIASEARSTGELLAWLRYEGHPPAWYAVLAALRSIVPEWAVLPLAATLCAAVVQGVILFASPFTRSELLLLASSQYVLFEFLTISRGTSLGVALVMLAMLAWRSRWLWAIMALLPMVDFLFGVVSGVFLILKLRERDIWWPGAALWLAGSAFAAWTIIPPGDMVNAFDALGERSGAEAFNYAWTGWLSKVGSLLVPFQGGIDPQWNTPVIPVAGFAWIGMLLLAGWLTREDRWHGVLLFGFFAFTLAFSLAVYPIGLRHLMLGGLLLILLVWLQRRRGAAPDPVFQVWLVVLAACGLASSAISSTRGFDRGGEVVAEIERLGLSDKHWIALPEWRAPAISGRSDIIFGRPEEQCGFSFVRWDHQSNALSSRDAFTQMLEREIASHGRTYLLSDRPFEDYPESLIRPLAVVERGYNGITYYLYVVGPEAIENAVTLPSCYPDRRDPVAVSTP